MFNVISQPPLVGGGWGLTPPQRCSQGILLPHLTGLTILRGLIIKHLSRFMKRPVPFAACSKLSSRNVISWSICKKRVIISEFLIANTFYEISSASCLILQWNHFFSRTVDVCRTYSRQVTDIDFANISRFKSPATMSKESVSWSGERTIAFLFL